VLEQVAETLVRLLGGAEAGELPHRPELAAIHRRIDAARERIDAGVAEVAVVVDRHCVGRGQGLVLEPGDRREELALSLPGRVEELAAPLLRRGWLLGVGKSRGRVFGRSHRTDRSGVTEGLRARG